GTGSGRVSRCAAGWPGSAAATHPEGRWRTRGRCSRDRPPEREPSRGQDGSLGGPNDVLALARQTRGNQQRGVSGLALLQERQPGSVLTEAGRGEAKNPEGPLGVNGHHASSTDDGTLLDREGEIRAEVKQVPAQREAQELLQETLADRRHGSPTRVAE